MRTRFELGFCFLVGGRCAETGEGFYAASLGMLDEMIGNERIQSVQEIFGECEGVREELKDKESEVQRLKAETEQVNWTSECTEYFEMNYEKICPPIIPTIIHTTVEHARTSGSFSGDSTSYDKAQFYGIIWLAKLYSSLFKPFYTSATSNKPENLISTHPTPWICQPEEIAPEQAGCNLSLNIQPHSTISSLNITLSSPFSDIDMYFQGEDKTHHLSEKDAKVMKTEIHFNDISTAVNFKVDTVLIQVRVESLQNPLIFTQLSLR